MIQKEQKIRGYCNKLSPSIKLFIGLVALLFWSNLSAQKNGNMVSLDTASQTAEKMELVSDKDFDSPAHEQHGCGNQSLPKEYQYDSSKFNLAEYQDFVRNQERTLTLRGDECIEIPVNVVVVYRNDGSGNDSEADVHKKFDTMNQMCQNSGWRVRFKITRFERVNNSNYYEIPDQFSKFVELRDRYTNFPNAVPFLMVGNCGPLGYGNINWLSIVSAYGHPAVCLHEIMHFFGIAHTHDTANGVELVNGSNCSTAGDQICDTQATPLIRTKNYSGCQYIGTATDPNGQRYRPDVSNVMAYSPINCQNSVTMGQQARLLYFLQNTYRSMVTSNCCVPTTPRVTITQPTCADPEGKVVIHNLPNGYWSFIVGGTSVRGRTVIDNLSPGRYRLGIGVNGCDGFTDVVINNLPANCSGNNTGTFSATKCYRFVARHSGKVMEVGGNSTANGGNVQQWTWIGSKSQVWRIKDVGGGYHRLVNGNSGLVLDLSGASTAAGANIYQWQWLNFGNQKWKLTRNADGYYVITSQHSGQAVDVWGGNQDGVNIAQHPVHNRYNQQFLIAETTCPAGTVALQSQNIFAATGHREGKKAIINWVSNANQRADYFVVQKLNIAVSDFEKLGLVNTKYSTTGNKNFYSITDNNPAEGENHYRIALYRDGETTPQYSEIITLDFSHLTDYALFPNPANDYVDIDLEAVKYREVDIQLTDLAGKSLQKHHIESVSTATFRINLEGLQTGHYFMSIKSDGRREVTKKLIIAK
jgi:hypothetical protein